jgi:hypothetical protein
VLSTSIVVLIHATVLSCRSISSTVSGDLAARTIFVASAMCLATPEVPSKHAKTGENNIVAIAVLDGLRNRDRYIASPELARRSFVDLRPAAGVKHNTTKRRAGCYHETAGRRCVGAAAPVLDGLLQHRHTAHKPLLGVGSTGGGDDVFDIRCDIAGHHRSYHSSGAASPA